MKLPLVRMKNQLPEDQGVSPPELLALAISKDLDVDKLERLMAMQEQWLARVAKESYYAAMSRFQATVPELKKSKVVDFTSKRTGERTVYAYAPLDSIVSQIKTPLEQCGFSYRWEFDETDLISVACIITHKDGHSEHTKMTAPADDSGKKNTVQQRGSTLTYLERYTLIGALGLATADSDNDGRSSEPVAEKTTAEKIIEIRDNLLPETYDFWANEWRTEYDIATHKMGTEAQKKKFLTTLQQAMREQQQLEAQ